MGAAQRAARACAAPTVEQREQEPAEASEDGNEDGLASSSVSSWTPHKLANPLTGQIALRVGSKVEAIVDLPDVPIGTRGKVMLVNGFQRFRYWVHFENGVDVGQLDGEQIGPFKKQAKEKPSS